MVVMNIVLFLFDFYTELNINLKSWQIFSLCHKLLQHLERWKGKAKYYPKLGTRISPQISEAELSWELKRGEFSEFRGLTWAWMYLFLAHFTSSSWFSASFAERNKNESKIHVWFHYFFILKCIFGISKEEQFKHVSRFI